MLLAQANSTLDLLTQVTGWVVLVFVAALGAVVVWKMFTNDIDLSKLISEPNGDASMSRFQLLIFTFVIAASLFLIVVAGHRFPDPIPQGILVLLGISSSSYLVSKGIQFSSPEGLVEGDPTIVISPQHVTTKAAGPAIPFQAKTVKLDDKVVVWSLNPATGMGTIDTTTGIYTPPAVPAGGQAPTGYVEVHATVADPAVSDIAIVHVA